MSDSFLTKPTNQVWVSRPHSPGCRPSSGKTGPPRPHLLQSRPLPHPRHPRPLRRRHRHRGDPPLRHHLKVEGKSVSSSPLTQSRRNDERNNFSSAASIVAEQKPTKHISCNYIAATLGNKLQFTLLKSTASL